MAIVIAAFSHQEVPINTEFMLNIGITGTGSNTEIRVKGELHKFYYRWNATDEQIEIRGSSDRIVYDAEFTITAGNQSRTGTFSVVPVAPVIVDPGDQTFFKGVDPELEIEINNQANKVVVKSDWIGLGYQPGGVGVKIIGEVWDEEFTVDDGILNIIAESPAGDDELDIDFDIRTRTFYGTNIYSSVAETDVFQVTLNDVGEVVSVSPAYSVNVHPYFLAVDADYLYSISIIGTLSIERWNRSASADVTPTSISSSSVTGQRGIAVDDSLIYVLRKFSSISFVLLFNKSDGVSQDGFILPSTIDEPRGVTVDGNNLIVYNHTTRELNWVSKDAADADGSTGITPLIKTVTLPPSESSGYYDITVSGNSILL